MAPTVEKWKAVFASVGADVEGASSEEIAEALGLGQRAARIRIRKAIKSNVLMFAGRKKAMRIDGVPTLVPVYRIVGEEDG